MNASNPAQFPEAPISEYFRPHKKKMETIPSSKSHAGEKLVDLLPKDLTPGSCRLCPASLIQ